MKLNSDCIRDVLLAIESLWMVTEQPNGTVAHTPLGISQLYDTLPQHSKADIFYTVFNLRQAGYIECKILYSGGGAVYGCDIHYMTYAGHQFLDRIRDPQTWTVVQKGLSAVRDYSLAAISSIAEGITSAAISAYLAKLSS